MTCGEPREAAESPGTPPDDTLISLAFAAGHGWVIDERGRLTRTPLLVHARAECLDGVAARSTEVEPLVGPDDRAPAIHALILLRASVREQVLIQAQQALAQVAAAGQVVGGKDQLIRTIEFGEIDVLIRASDAAPRTLREIDRVADGRIPTFELGLDRDDLGARIGQPPRAAVGLPRSDASAPLFRQLARLAAISGTPAFG